MVYHRLEQIISNDAQYVIFPCCFPFMPFGKGSSGMRHGWEMDVTYIIATIVGGKVIFVSFQD